MCHKKKFDEIGAMLAVADAKRKNNNKRLETRYYWCYTCNSYHLTSQPPDKASARRGWRG